MHFGIGFVAPLVSKKYLDVNSMPREYRKAWILVPAGKHELNLLLRDDINCKSCPLVLS